MAIRGELYCWWRRWCGRRRQRRGRGPDEIARAGMQPREASGGAIYTEVALPSCACRGHDLLLLPQPPPHTPSTTGRHHRTPSMSPRTHARPGRAATRSGRDGAGSMTTRHRWPWRRWRQRASAKGQDGRARHATPCPRQGKTAVPPSLDSSWPPEAPRAAARRRRAEEERGGGARV
jgi:hypothetical protein